MARTGLEPKIELQELLHKQIYDALQGETLQKIRSLYIDQDENDTYIRSDFEGNSLKVEKNLLPDVYDLCQEVLQALNYTEPVDFYISGNSEINAFSISSEVQGKPHIINIQSALFKLLNRDELKFIIGHEVGHLINRDSDLTRLIRFVYPNYRSKDYNYEDMPDYLANRIVLHEQFAELGADRWGYMACENLETCVKVFYKLESGLDLGDMNVSINTLIENNKKRLDFFLHEGGRSEDDHPVNAIRIQAVYLFAAAKTQKALREGMKELTEILWNLNPLEYNLALFYATAGLIVASADGKIVPDEKAKIIERLGEYEFCPQQVLNKIEKSDVPKLFNDVVKEMLDNVPGIGIKLLHYFVEIACADKKIAEEELALIFDFGQKVGLSVEDISKVLANEIRDNYVPKVM